MIEDILVRGERVETYKVEIQNKCNNYDPENDWMAEGYGYTIDAAFKRALISGYARDSDNFVPDKIYLTTMNSVLIEGKLYDERRENPCTYPPYDLYEKHSDLCKRLSDKATARYNAKVAAELAKNVEREKAEYERLKKKFETL